MTRLNPLKQESDYDLWSCMRQGDHEAFSKLYHKYFKSLYIYGIRITPRKAIVKDTIQELFIDFWAKSKNVEIPDKVKIYILTSFKYKLLQTIQKTANSKIVSLNDYGDHIRRNYNPQPQDVEQVELMKITTFLDHLTRKQKEIIHLKYFENLDNEEISQIADINYQSVSNLLHRAIKKMRAALLTKSKSKIQ